MAKARPLNVLLEQTGSGIEDRLGRILREEHGAHGLNFLGETAIAGEVVHLRVSRSSENGGLLFRYAGQEGESITAEVGEEGPEIERALSRFALARLTIPLHEQTSRPDYQELSKYSGERPNLEADPSEWISGNPFIADLCRRYPQYGNLVRYLCNERGLFLKVGNQPNQRAYWNSTLNGGLPAFKKADPIHEGTFKLHDMFHFVPVDPLLGSRSLDGDHKATYIAHRLLSEASTLVLADMVAVADARLGEQGYDISKRKIFPVYQSIHDAQRRAPDIDKLLAANAYFCFTGDPAGFRALGASDEILDEYKSKYETIFSDDFMWNLQNFEAMVSERQSNGLMPEYYEWLESHALFPTLRDYDEIITSGGEGLDIARLLSLFRADFTNALNYHDPIDDTRRVRLAYQKYLAGQRIIFARFGDQLRPGEALQSFDRSYAALAESDEQYEISRHGQNANLAIDAYLSGLEDRTILLPHEVALYRFSAPLYPIKFVNYEKSKDAKARQLTENMREFLHVNKQQLARLLEGTEA